MKINKKIINLIIFLIYKFVKGENNKSVVLSTEKYENLDSTKLLNPLRKYDDNLYVIASVNVNGEKSGLELNKEKFSKLGELNYLEYNEDCDVLHELLNKTFERIGFDFIENNETLNEVSSGLWLYLPVMKYTTLDDFKTLVDKYKSSKNVTLLVTDCDLLKSKSGLKHKSKQKEDNKDKEEIKTTPLIFQQISVVLFFILVLWFGLYFALNIKTPSSLLTPQPVKTKIS